MNLLKLLTPSYILDPVPGMGFSYGWPLFILFALMIALSYYVHSYLKTRPNHKIEARFLGGIPSRMREFGILGLLVTFLRDQNIPYLGMRIWIILVLISCLLYGIYVLRNYTKNFNLALALTHTKKVEDKYVPKTKRNKRK